MRLVRGLAGVLLWLVSALLGLVGVIACLTIILLPLGIPLLGYARRTFALSLKLMLPRAVTHPVQTTEKSLRRRSRAARESVMARKPDTQQLRKSVKKATTRARKRLPF